MSEIEPRPTQTKVKHTILDKYLKQWGGIILSGLRRRGITQGHFVYVDTNGSFGRYNGELEDAEAKRPLRTVYGSPIIGLQALDSLVEQAREWNISLKTNAIIIEAKKHIYDELKSTLQKANYISRVKETKNFSQLKSFEIALVNDDPTKMAYDLISFTKEGGYKYAFFFIDPIGPKGLPLKNYVAPIISQPRHDAIIYMPYYDLHKKTPLATKILLDDIQTKLLENYNQMFGSVDWQEIAKKYRPDLVLEEWLNLPIGDSPDLYEIDDFQGMNMELELANFYKASLQKQDKDLWVKSISLRFPDKERTVYYLYLTTHDPTGALVMNQLLWDAEFQEHELRWRLRDAKRQKGQSSFLNIFGLDTPPDIRQPRPSKKEISDEIFELLRGKKLNLRNIYRLLVDAPYFPSEIQSGLRLLKQEGNVQYDGSQFTNDLEITVG